MTTDTVARRIAIIGAGWSGLQIAAVLRDCGHDVHVFEQLDDVGGTWHPANAYAGLTTHTPAFRCQFHDFDGWKDRDPLARLDAGEVFANCRAYASAKGLSPLIALRHRVMGVRYESARRLNHLTLRDDATGRERVESFDFVVSTQFNAPRVPAWPGREQFTGTIAHSNDVTVELLDRIKRERLEVVLVGGSKAASDIALLFLSRGQPFTWLVRRMYWFLSFDKGYFDLARGRPARRWHRWLYFGGLALAKGPISAHLIFNVWRAVGLLRNPGQVPGDESAFHHGWLDESQVAALRKGTTQVRAGIAGLGTRTLRTDDGRTLPCDLLIAATGCDPMAVPIPLWADDAPVAPQDVELVYRYSVIPELPRLCFTGYAMFGLGPLSAYHRAAWIIRHLEQDLDTEALRAIARGDGDRPYLFRRGSFLFEHAERLADLLATAREMNRRMGEGLYSYADLWRHYRDVAVRHIYAPLGGIARFLAARRSRAPR